MVGFRGELIGWSVHLIAVLLDTAGRTDRPTLSELRPHKTPSVNWGKSKINYMDAHACMHAQTTLSEMKVQAGSSIKPQIPSESNVHVVFEMIDPEILHR